MTDRNSWSPLEKRAREWFSRSVESVDAPTLSKLHEARCAALAGRNRDHAARGSGWLAAGALASLALVAITLWATRDKWSGSPEPASDMVSAEVIELIVAGEDLDLAADELEFYAWLDQFVLPTDEDLS